MKRFPSRAFSVCIKEQACERDLESLIALFFSGSRRRKLDTMHIGMPSHTH
jgi:hypothetical protein